MASESIILFTLFITILAASQVQAQLGILGDLLGLINISGTVFCSQNGNIVTNSSTITPPFPNALVQLTCNGNVISSTTTNALGVFSIFMNPLQVLLSTLLSTCNVVVATPLSKCNSNFPASGLLQAPLALLGNTFQGLLGIVRLVTTEFQLVNILN